MVEEGKAADQAVDALVDDGLSASTLSSMNPSELFRLAAELGSTNEAPPSCAVHGLRLNRFIE
jgi:hypothetical protein